ncbi:zf-HC2 domain-containing protein [Lysobacter korlensis]|uniref:Zf-HC2 domain-containing protein n=1 Tax=Lysobacter korlensis TaxID=553636 RepID=A0ABV6RXN2_9GAMM
MSAGPRNTGPAADHAAYAEWDAAYVLGALSPAERREFEQHLRGCAECAAGVAALAGMPGLLSRVPREDGLALLDSPVPSEEVPASLLPRLELAARRDRRRRRAGTWVLAAAAAAAGVIGTLAVPQLIDRPAETVTAELDPVIDIPLTATVELTPTDAGTHLDMICSYPYGGGDGRERSYDLFVIDAAGEARRVSTWTSRAGHTVEVSATIDTPTDDIETVEVRSSVDGDVLLTASLE